MITPQGLGTSTASSEFATVNRLAKLAGIVDVHGKAILDIGCNDAAYTVELAQSARVAIGIDIESERLRDASRRITTREVPAGLSLMDAERLGFRDSSFDVVFVNEVLEHIPDQDSALDEIHRVLGEEGFVVLFAPNRLYIVETHGAHIGKRTVGRFIPLIHWLPRFVARHFMNARSYTPREVRQLLAHHGFAIVHQSCLFPPLDGLRNRLSHCHLTSMVDIYRRMMPTIGRIPLLRSMGLSVFAVAIKSNQPTPERGNVLHPTVPSRSR
jgi:ubiquinone/menaquinone biosynthesis C-methylase UbiE